MVYSVRQTAEVSPASLQDGIDNVVGSVYHSGNSQSSARATAVRVAFIAQSIDYNWTHSSTSDLSNHATLDAVISEVAISQSLNWKSFG